MIAVQIPSIQPTRSPHSPSKNPKILAQFDQNAKMQSQPCTCSKLHKISSICPKISPIHATSSLDNG